MKSIYVTLILVFSSNLLFAQKCDIDTVYIEKKEKRINNIPKKNETLNYRLISDSTYEINDDGIKVIVINPNSNNKIIKNKNLVISFGSTQDEGLHSSFDITCRLKLYNLEGKLIKDFGKMTENLMPNYRMLTSGEMIIAGKEKLTQEKYAIRKYNIYGEKEWEYYLEDKNLKYTSLTIDLIENETKIVIGYDAEGRDKPQIIGYLQFRKLIIDKHGKVIFDYKADDRPQILKLNYSDVLIQETNKISLYSLVEHKIMASNESKYFKRFPLKVKSGFAFLYLDSYSVAFVVFTREDFSICKVFKIDKDVKGYLSFILNSNEILINSEKHEYNITY